MYNALANFHQITDGGISQEDKEGYKIGVVSKIAGIGTETLRAWERRYKAVVPTRSASGDRSYSRDDIAKLLLLKRLVDAGNSIGTIANLDTEKLQSMAEEANRLSSEFSTENTHSATSDSTNVVLLGDFFPLRIIDGLEDVNNINVLGTYNNLDEYQQLHSTTEQTSVVIVEKPTINANTNEEIRRILEITGAWHVVIIYGFANHEQIEALQSSQTTLVRSSVDVQELARMCILHTGGSDKLPSLVHGSTLHYEQNIPTRIFSNQQLTKLAGISNTIKCECPNHISDLVKNLVTFEIYSAECENENQDDAALHNYLHATTAQARSLLEEALSHLIRIEGIDINNPN